MSQYYEQAILLMNESKIYQKISKSIKIYQNYIKLYKHIEITTYLSLPDFPKKTGFQTHFLHNKIVFPTIMSEISGIHINFSMRMWWR